MHAQHTCHTAHLLTNCHCRRQEGFTLVELMIVVAIIGILSAIAIPTYHGYTQKSEATVGVSTTSALTSSIDLFIQETGKFPQDNDLSTLGATTTMSTLGTISLHPDASHKQQGQLDFHYGENSQLSGKVVIWKKEADTWSCHQNAMAHLRGCLYEEQPL